MSEVHSAVVKVAVDEEQMAKVVIHCVECGGELEFDIPAIHLGTLSNACAIAAAKLGVKAETEALAEFNTEARTVAECDARLAELRRKAHTH